MMLFIYLFWGVYSNFCLYLRSIPFFSSPFLIAFPIFLWVYLLYSWSNTWSEQFFSLPLTSYLVVCKFWIYCFSIQAEIRFVNYFLLFSKFVCLIPVDLFTENIITGSFQFHVVVSVPGPSVTCVSCPRGHWDGRLRSPVAAARPASCSPTVLLSAHSSVLAAVAWPNILFCIWKMFAFSPLELVGN